MKIDINKRVPRWFLLQKPRTNGSSFFRIMNDDRFTQNFSRLLYGEDKKKQCRYCEQCGLSCRKPAFDTYDRLFDHLKGKVNDQPMLVVVYPDEVLQAQKYSIVRTFDKDNTATGTELQEPSKIETGSESEEPEEPDHQPNPPNRDERSARAAVPGRQPAGNRVRLVADEVPEKFAAFCDLEIEYHGHPNGLQTDIPNRCPTLYLKDVHLKQFRDFVEFLFFLKLDKFGILLFRLPPSFTAEFKNLTFEQLGSRLGRFSVLRQSVKKVTEGCYQIIGEIEGKITSNAFRPKEFSLNDFRSEIGRSERNGAQTREECLSFLRQEAKKPSRPKIGLYATDINRDLTNGKLNNIIGNVLRSTNIPGVATPYTYAASFLNSFNLHTEDLDLHSASFHLSGRNKFWWGVAGIHKAKVIELLRGNYVEEFDRCPHAFRHKQFFVEAEKLRAAGIPVFEADQEMNTAVFTFPAAFHEGLNAGESIAVAINFDSEQWYLKHLKPAIKENCKCGDLTDTVTEKHLKTVIEWWAEKLSPKERVRRKRPRGEE